jgi:hypothetical protein
VGKEQDWEISWTGKDVIDSKGNVIVLEWTLNRVPDTEWVQFLVSSGVGKSGSAEFIASEPRLVHDRVRITVPDRDLEAAVTYVEESIRAANQKFNTQVMTRRRREAAEREAQEAANQQQLKDARDRLNRLS